MFFVQLTDLFEGWPLFDIAALFFIASMCLLGTWMSWDRLALAGGHSFSFLLKILFSLCTIIWVTIAIVKWIRME